MMDRALDGMECMTDRFDRAATLNFTIAAEVRGPLDTAATTAGLRALEARHPLLRAGIDRTGEVPRFVDGGAAPIPLTEVKGDAGEAHRRMESSLRHVPWADDGPRARLQVIHHSDDHHTLLLTLHHTVGDGTSGILAMRDLLRASQGIALGGPLPSPGPEHFLPPKPADVGERVGALLKAQAAKGAPVRPRDQEASPAERMGELARINFNATHTQAALAAAKAARATLQGYIAAHVLRAIAAEMDDDMPLLRIGHPVNLRRLLARVHPKGEPIGDAIGYYVSAIDTTHHVDRSAPLAQLAHEVTTDLHAALDEGRALLTGPVAGVSLVGMTAKMSDEEFRVFAEQKVMHSSAGVSNLGRLEALGMEPRVGALEVESVYFAMASSIFGALGLGVTTFRDRLTVCMRVATPLISAERFERIVERVQSGLAA